jgi:hypothetical protein
VWLEAGPRHRRANELLERLAAADDVLAIGGQQHTLLLSQNDQHACSREDRGELLGDLLAAVVRGHLVAGQLLVADDRNQPALPRLLDPGSNTRRTRSAENR